MSEPQTQQRKKANKKPKVQFKVVQQSYEDKDYEDKPKPVLVPAGLVDQRFKRRRRDQHPSFVFGEDLPEDYTNKRNMLTNDDTRPGEEHMFDDEVEEDFDEGFIHDMMYGEPDEDDELFGGEDDDDEFGGFGEDEEYPEHDPTEMNRPMDKQFAKMMREFEVDEEINDAGVDDPRTHGPLEVEQYMNALEEFVEDNAGFDMETAGPLKNKGLLHQLKMMGHRSGVFDSNKEGVFVTTLLPDKVSRFMNAYKKETDEIRAKARETYAASQQRAAERAAAGLPAEDEEDAKRAIIATSANADEEEPLKTGNPNRGDFDVVEIKPKERYDCETIVSTYSTLYNHPNVIVAARKKLNPKSAMGIERKRQQEAWEARVAAGTDKQQQQQQQQQSNQNIVADMTKAPSVAAASAPVPSSANKKVVQQPEEEEEEEEEEVDTFAKVQELGIDLSVRPKDETSEEKKLRRQLIKQLQREKRVQKKDLKTVYRDATVANNFSAPVSRQARTQVSLSMEKRVN